MEKIEFLAAVRLVTRNPERLVAFYRDVLGLPLHEELQDGRPPFYACSLGDLHFSIHGQDELAEETPAGVGAVRLAFAVFDVDEVAASLEEGGVELAYPPTDQGWCKVTAVRDPDGNYVELTELGDDWYRHLEKRPAQSPRRRRREKPLEAIDES